MNTNKASKYIMIAGLLWTAGSMGGCAIQPVTVDTIGELQMCYTRMSGSKHSIREYYYCDFKYGDDEYLEVAYRPSAYYKMKGTDGTRYHIDVMNPDRETWGFGALWGLALFAVGVVISLVGAESKEYPVGRIY